MKILVLGSAGQVGFELLKTLSYVGSVSGVDREQVDLCDQEQLRFLIRESHPDVIVNAAAYTAVDKAETERSLAHSVNAIAPEIIAEEARAIGALLIHYSTDYVFSGKSDRPYTEEDPPAPLNTYGITKLEGEERIARTGARYLILRTSWVYGARGSNFFLTMLRLAAGKPEIRVVNDQIGAPTWSYAIASATATCVLKATADPVIPSGIFHLTASGETSWFGFATAIFQSVELPLKPKLTPIATHEYPTAARRPLYSLLSNAKLERHFGIVLPPWQAQLQTLVQQIASESQEKTEAW